MSSIIIKNKNFGGLFSKLRISIGGNTISLGSNESKELTLPKGTYDMLISDNIWYKTESKIDIEGNHTLEIKGSMPIRYNMIALSLIILSFVLFKTDVIPSIYYYITLIVCILPLLYMGFFKKNTYYNIHSCN